MSKLLFLVLLFLFTYSTTAQELSSYDSFQDRGIKNFTKGDYDQAIENFSRAIDVSSRIGDGKPSSTLGFDSTLETSNTSETRVVDLRTADAYLNRGRVYLFKGELDRAIEDFTSALKIRPTLANAYYCRGTTRLAQKQFDQAVADFDRMIKLEPENWNGYVGRGVVRFNMGDGKLALADLEHAKKLAPKNAIVAYQLGDIHRELGDLDGAMKEFEFAIKRDSKMAQGYLGRGLVHLQRSEPDDAIVDISKAILLDPRLPLFGAAAAAYRIAMETTHPPSKSIRRPVAR